MSYVFYSVFSLNMYVCTYNTHTVYVCLSWQNKIMMVNVTAWLYISVYWYSCVFIQCIELHVHIHVCVYYIWVDSYGGCIESDTLLTSFNIERDI